jgi:hypothetical protein
MSVSNHGNRLSAIGTRKASTPQHNRRDQDELRSQLQKEVDKLAVLMQEVREQSIRVQAVADAIGDKFLLDGVDRPLSTNAGDGQSDELPFAV